MPILDPFVLAFLQGILRLVVGFLTALCDAGGTEDQECLFISTSLSLPQLGFLEPDPIVSSRYHKYAVKYIKGIQWGDQRWASTVSAPERTQLVLMQHCSLVSAIRTEWREGEGRGGSGTNGACQILNPRVSQAVQHSSS